MRLSGACPHRCRQREKFVAPYLCASQRISRSVEGNRPACLARLSQFSRALGASKAAKSTFAQEWCHPTQSEVRRSSLPGWRSRAGGGGMATGNQLVPGAPVTAEQTAAGRPVTDEQAAWAAWAAQGSAAQGFAAQGVAAQGLAAQGAAARGFAAEPAAVRAPRRLWRGAGGRCLVWAFRAVLWAVLVLIGYRGVAAIVTGAPVVGSTAATAARAQGFPVALAKAYALQFGQAYLNF